ncbi:MAG: VOC family protein [Actinomycetota bacterium]
MSRTQRRRGHLLRNGAITAAFAIVLSITSAAQPANAVCGDGPGAVSFPATEVVSSSASTADKNALISTITKSWQRYLAMDVSGYRTYVTSDVTKMSGRWGASGLQQGADAVASALPVEWTAYERPTGVIAESFKINHAELWAEGSSATALYWVDVRGGARWCYTDQGLVVQAFTKVGSSWKIAHQTDSWNLSFRVGRSRPGAETFPFDWVTPVKDMNRQVAFYSQFAGPPEYVTADRASFQLKGAHFILDRTRLNGLATITPGKPNGWAVFYVDDVRAERDRLKAAGVRFVQGTDTTLLKQGSDLYAVGLDRPTENPFVILQRNFTAAGSGVPPEPTGFTGTDARTLAAKKIATAWLRTDGATMQTMYKAGRWFDDTRTRVRGLEAGSTLATTLANEYWSGYDRTSGGLVASMAANSVRVRPLGTRSVVSYEMVLTGTGAHPFRDTAFVTHVLNANARPLVTMVVGAEVHAGGALSLDYSGYPVSDLTAAETFYRDVMKLGRPYPDSGYRGWWADSGVVFGIYIAKPSRDGLPRAGVPSGYMSFWIASAEMTYNRLKQTGSTFPLIPAINTRKGIDPQPGYTQVVATDPDGNVQVFTEYTGQ